jgi:hypothetical protein
MKVTVGKRYTLRGCKHAWVNGARVEVTKVEGTDITVRLLKQDPNRWVPPVMSVEAKQLV